jgi:hypothetical protein
LPAIERDNGSLSKIGWQQRIDVPVPKLDSFGGKTLDCRETGG